MYTASDIPMSNAPSEGLQNRDNFICSLTFDGKI